MVFLEFIGILLLIVAILAFFGFRLSHNAGKKAAKIIKTIDEKYLDYIEKSMSSYLLSEKNDEIDTQKICEEALIILKPEVDAVISHINATDLSDVKINYESIFFKNTVTLAESFFEKRHKRNTDLISQNDIDKFYQAVKDAVKADVTRRVIDWKTGNF